MLLADDCIGEAVAQKAAALQDGEVRPESFTLLPYLNSRALRF